MVCPECYASELTELSDRLECTECNSQFEIPSDEDDELEEYQPDLDDDEEEDL